MVPSDFRVFDSRPPVTLDEIFQNFFGHVHVGSATHSDQAISIFWRKIALVPVYVYPNFKPFGICFGVKLRGVDVLPEPDHLIAARVGGQQMRATVGQFLQRFFVADKGVKFGWQVCQ